MIPLSFLAGRIVFSFVFHLINEKKLSFIVFSCFLVVVWCLLDQLIILRCVIKIINVAL